MPKARNHYEAMAAAIGAMEGLSEKKMFGGVCFMLHGNMLAGAMKSGAMFRVGKDREAEALALPGVRAMDLTGRRMGGLVQIDPETFDDTVTMAALLALATGFVGALPPK